MEISRTSITGTTTQKPNAAYRPLQKQRTQQAVLVHNRAVQRHSTKPYHAHNTM
jgi:hypothetical protein